MNPNSSAKRSFVAIVDNSCRLYNNPTTVKQEVLSLTDPYTKEPRQYLRISDTKKSQVYEIQSLSHPRSKEYSSFFLGSRVVSNKSLHLVTPIDPLYFLLPYFDQVHGLGVAPSFQWQPWEQICSSNNISREILDCLDSVTFCKSEKSQLRHLFEVNDQYGDDMVLFKFQREKALGWLQKKLAKIELIIRGQIIMERGAGNHFDTKGNSNEGAFSSSFRLPEEEVEQEGSGQADQNNNNADSSKIRSKSTGKILRLELTAAEEDSMHQEAAQIVCEYLSPYWRKELLQSIFPLKEISSGNTTVPTTLLEGAKSGISSCQSNSSAVAVTPPNAGQKRSYLDSGMSEADKLLQYTMGTGGGGTLDDDKYTKKKVPLKSVALKRLEKTNTKGMKTMGSFFSVKKKKTKKVEHV